MTVADSKSQAERARDFIRRGIDTGDYAVDSFLPPAEQIAERIDCSIHAVRRAMRSLADEGLLRSRRGKGTFVRRAPYVGRVVMLLSTDADSNTIFQIPVSRALYEAGYRVEILPSAFGSGAVRRRAFDLQSGNEPPRALVCVAPEAHTTKEKGTLEEYAAAFSRRVFFQFEPEHVAAPAVRILCDPVRAAREVAQHLLELGHRRAGVFGGNCPGEGSSAERRAIALQQILEVAGAECRIFYHSCGRPRAGFIAEHDLMAFWDVTDDAALRLVSDLHRAGLRVPEDVSVVGMNDTPLSRKDGIDLTSVSVNPEAVAERIVGELSRARDDAEAEEKLMYIEPELIARTSTAARRTEETSKICS